MAIQIVILAAGVGKRMHSKLPKVLHCLAGKPLLEHVICTSLELSPRMPPIIIYGHQGKILRERFSHHNVRWIEQKEQLGTGHALSQALPGMADDAKQVLVLYGDVPLISLHTLKKLIETTPLQALGMLTVQLNHPYGYGRVKRDKKNNIIQIIEEKDATATERMMTEINSGIYLIPVELLKQWLPKIKNNNAQGEYYLTDIISQAAENIPIHSVQPELNEEILGINDRVQLAQLERFYQQQMAEKFMRQGVTLLDPARFDVRGNVQIGIDVTIDVNVILEGDVVIGNECVIGPHTILRNVILGDRVEIKANCILDGAKVASDSIIGPFARLRPGTVLAENVHIGNFVEIKQSHIGQGSKINHLSYIGDSEVGKHVNIGAGTITCNYDGANKHKTCIGDDVQIGSNTQLVAPVTIGEGSTIGAGSTVTKDTPPYQLTLTHRLEQRSYKNWERPKNHRELENNG